MTAILASLIRISSCSNATSCCNRSFSACSRTRLFTLSAAQLLVETAAYWAREITCRMAERTRLGQPFGSLKFARFSCRKVYPPTLRFETEGSITATEHEVYAPSRQKQKSLDQLSAIGRPV